MTINETILARARSAIGKRTIYKLDAPPPNSHLSTWPERIRGDCSGFIGWCCGLPRHPIALNGEELSTNTIYADAVGAHHLFRVLAEPVVGGFVVYPHYQFDPHGREHAGHVAVIAQIKSRDDYDIIDCASSSYTETGDAIREHQQEAFSAHARSASAARKNYPDVLPGRLTRSPIFACFVSHN